MQIKTAVLSLILLSIMAQADSSRREPSIFLEYERELKKDNDTLKNDESPFKPISISKPASPIKPTVKAVAFVAPVLKNDKADTETIGQDSKPFLLVSKPTIAVKTTPTVETTNAEEPASNTQKIVKNFKDIKNSLLAYAKDFLGTPYGFGKKGGDKTDCSGFTQQVFGQFGIALPHSAAEQAQLGENVSMDNLQVGDLLFYRTYKSDPSHVAIYAGDGQIIHASYSSKKVQFDSIDKEYYKKRFLCAKRIALNDATTDE
jgi:cell wall-associated NlpC family hydrolase